MIVSVDDLKNYSIVLLLYTTGTSGEFLAGALTSSIEAFAKTQDQWISPNRKNFNDALMKTLNGGWHNINNDDVINRFNWYLESNSTNDTFLHLALAHPDPASIRFIQQYLSHAPVIEISTDAPVSTAFKTLSQSKVSYEDYVNGGDNRKNALTREQYQAFQKKQNFYNRNLFKANRHLTIEWQQVMLNDTLGTFDKICDFLQCQGHREMFADQVREYLDRNQDILKQISV